MSIYVFMKMDLLRTNSSNFICKKIYLIFYPSNLLCKNEINLNQKNKI